MKSLIVLAALATAGLLAAAPAVAQAPAAPVAAAPGKVPKAPIDITADRLDTENTGCVYTWTGSAEALRDTSRLRADVLIAHLEVKKDPKGAKAAPASGSTAPGTATANSCGEMTTLDAKGHVYYASMDGKRVHGDNAHYDAASTIITITGDVTAVQGQNVMRGTKMVDNTQTGEGYMEGGARGAGAKNRPRAVLYPKDNADQAAATPGAAAPAADAATPAKPKKKSAK